MTRARGANGRALDATLVARGVDLRGELAALVVLARTLAHELDEAEAPTAGMASAYLSALRQLLELTKPVDKEDAGERPAETLSRLRSV